MTECEKEIARWQQAHQYCEAVRSCYEKMQKTNPTEEIKKVYAYVKEVIPKYYIDTDVPYMHSSYDFLRYEVLRCEDRLRGQFIIDSSPMFNFFDNKNVTASSSPNNVIEYIVHCVRQYLVLKYSLNKDRPIDIKRLDFENDCVIASNKVKELCDQLGILCYVIGIYPGYDRYSNLFDGNGFHMCNIVVIANEYYLIDCTYRQFFSLKQNLLERLGIVGLAGVKPGIFMLMDEKRKNIAERLLKDGWVKLDSDILKYYLDGFTLSFRNGLYYEQTRDFSYTTNYKTDDYIRFLSGEDSQLNHEDKEVLGYQRKPLKNHKITFR